MSPQRIRSLLRWALVIALLFFAFAVRVVTSAAADARNWIIPGKENIHESAA